jgi:hypothetical protein
MLVNLGQKEKTAYLEIFSILGQVKHLLSIMAVGEMSNGTFEPVVKHNLAGGTKVLRIAAAGAAIVFSLTAVAFCQRPPFVSLNIFCQCVLNLSAQHSRLWH